jgi:excisionase family DNA binding protein
MNEVIASACVIRDVINSAATTKQLADTSPELGALIPEDEACVALIPVETVKKVSALFAKNYRRQCMGNNKPMTLKQAAEFTQYSEPYLYELVRKKQIPHYKPQGEKGHVFFKQSELEEFMFRNRISADYEVSAAADANLNRET